MKKIILSVMAFLISFFMSDARAIECSTIATQGYFTPCHEWNPGVENNCGDGCTYTYDAATKTITVTATSENATIQKGAFMPYSYATNIEAKNVVLDGKFNMEPYAFLELGATISGKNGQILVGDVARDPFVGTTLSGDVILAGSFGLGANVLERANLTDGSKVYCPGKSAEECRQSILDSCLDSGVVYYGGESCRAATVQALNSVSDSPVGCSMPSSTDGCTSCFGGYELSDNTCVMKTCDDYGELSVCEDSVSGCTRNVCAAGTTLADGTSCYVQQSQDITPTCGENAHVAEDENTCTCACNSGYKGDGASCEMKTCAEMFENSTNSCTDSVSGCSVTTCTEVGTLADGETKCYTSTTVDHTPTCDANAHVTGEGSGCTCACNSGFKGDGSTCTMLTCAETYDGSSEEQCEDSVSGCSVTTCSQVGTLADSTPCYKASTTDHTPHCDSNATLSGEGAGCTCSCNTGYTGNGLNCQAIECGAGQYLDGSECKTCEAGTYAAAGDNHCSTCGAREYSAAGAESCSSRQNTVNCHSFATDSDECTSCGEGYKTENGACVSICEGSKVFWKGECYDEYPFAKKHYTPAEAARFLKDDGNVVTIVFKK